MRRLLIGIVLIVSAAYLTLSLYGFLQLSRARRLVKAVEELQVGVPIPKEQQAQFSNLRCVPKWGCFKRLSNLPFVDFFAQPRRLPPKLALSDWWGVIARVSFDADGSVLEKSVGIDDGQYHQFGTLAISVRRDASLFDPCAHPGVATHLGYLPRREHRTNALLVDISPDADQSLIRRAFDLHLYCLNSIRGCKTPGDIAPAAWQDSVFHAGDYQELSKSCSK
ncbi:MAG: hypothetical protein WA872_11770 [Candidatus Sulfotelmatobacter sp.]